MTKTNEEDSHQRENIVNEAEITMPKQKEDVKILKPDESTSKTHKNDETKSESKSTSPAQSVRKSIGEWESGKPEPPPRTSVTPKKVKTVELLRPKPKATTSQIESKAMARRNSTEATKSPPTQEKQNYKLKDRLAEARQCVTRAKTNLGNSRNIKTEIKTEVMSAIDRLYQLVKEGESVKGKVQTNTPDTRHEPEKEKEPEKQKEQLREERKEENELMKKLEEHAKLIHDSNERMKDLKETLERQQEHQERQSYASVAAVNPGRQHAGQAALHSVVVTAKNEKETGEQILNRIREAVNAKESGIIVDKIRKAKDRKVIVGCRTEEERQKVKDKLRGAEELNVEEIRNKDPLVILKDVFKFNSDEDVLNALKNQNKEVVTEDIKHLKMEIVYKKHARNPHMHHIVMRVSPKIWRRMVDMETIRIDLQRVRVTDQSPLVQCSLCLGYGHGRRFCKETTEKCCHCGGPHMRSECADWLAGAVPTCTNCTLAKADRTDHNAFSQECSIRRKWEALARATIAYC